MKFLVLQLPDQMLMTKGNAGNNLLKKDNRFRLFQAPIFDNIVK